MAVKRALAQFESIHALCEKYPDAITIATTAEEVRTIAASGRVAALMGLEGGYMIEDDLRVLRMFHKLGVRYTGADPLVQHPLGRLLLINTVTYF